MKVVLLGGSFNPIHDGHKKILNDAIKAVGADQGWFILANDPPLKDDQMLNFDVRKKFIEIMIYGFDKLKVCDIERHLPTPNYTVNTIKRLKKIYPSTKFYFLIGTDQAAQFDKWHKYEKILKQVQLIIYPREGYKAIKGLNAIKLKEETLDVSSTRIRENRSFLTHPEILNQMALNGYYANERLKTHLKNSRLKHTLRVADVSVEIAQSHNLDTKLAYGIAIAHDLLKQIAYETMAMYLTSNEMSKPKELWHAYASARYHSRHMYVKDKRFLNALYHHTLGYSTNDYSKILYIADKCEPQRNTPNSDMLIQLAKKDLNKAFKLTKKQSDEYFERKKNESN